MPLASHLIASEAGARHLTGLGPEPAAGDVFHGAFAYGLTQAWERERNLRFACQAAAIKCTRFGGRLGAPTLAEVEASLFG